MMDILTWSDDLYPLVTRWFDDKLEKRTDLITALIGKESTKRIDIREQGLGGYGYVPEYDGTTIPELNAKRGFQTIYTPKERAAKATVQYKYAKVDMSGEAKKAGTRMADSLAITQVRDFYNLFANGFTTNIGADGKALFATDHPVNNEGASAGTFSNLITDTFSVASVTKAQTMAQRWKTYDLADFDCDLDIVLVSPELEPKAKELFGKEAKLIPDDSAARNGANPVVGMKYFVIKGLSAKQWCVADSNLLKEYMKMVYITAPMVIPQKSPNPLVSEFIGYMDYTYGFSDARCIIGSNPA